MSKLRALLATLSLFVVAFEAQAAPVQWSSSSGGNGHWYDVIFTNAAMTWSAAKSAASSSAHLNMTGHLATVTSQEEQTFLNDLNPSWDRAWLGGTDEASEGTWTWITGEAFEFSNWSPGEPNNSFNGPENYMLGWWDYTSGWNDAADSEAFQTSAYAVEYSAPAPIPVPAAFPLLGTALAVLGSLGWRRRQA